MIDLASQLIDWYRNTARDLPWRNTKNPYHIWLSEVILQQTQVKFGLPYYLKILAKYPDISSLASANPDEFMRLWQGLGYYRRAENLLIAAKQIERDFHGVFPTTFHEIQLLKGVGEYTAAAIASFAFGEAVPVVDGNVKRVISRLFAIREYPESSKGKKAIREALNLIFDPNQPDTFNQAIMEFGALQCTKSPDCSQCVFQSQCLAYAKNLVKVLPVKKIPKAKRQRFFHYFLHFKNGKLALQQRGDADIWKQLYEFPLIESDAFSSENQLEKVFESQYSSVIKSIIEVKSWPVHVLSHQEIYVKLYLIVDVDFPIQLTYYTNAEIEKLPKSRMMDKILMDDAVIALFSSSL